MPGRERFARRLGDAPGCQRRGPAKKIPLSERDPHIAHDDEVRLVFDSFGHKTRTARAGEMLHGADGFELERIVGDVVDEKAIDLDDVGL